MNFTSKKNDKSLLFSITKTKGYFTGWFRYTSAKGNYLSASITENDDWLLMKKLFFSANREIPKCYFENIEDMTSEICNEFFNSKQEFLCKSI